MDINYILDQLKFYHDALSNEISPTVAKHLVEIIKCYLEKLTTLFHEDFDGNGI